MEAFGQRHADDAAWKRTYGGMGGDSDDEGGDKDADGLAWGLRAPIEKKVNHGPPPTDLPTYLPTCTYSDFLAL